MRWLSHKASKVSTEESKSQHPCTIISTSVCSAGPSHPSLAATSTGALGDPINHTKIRTAVTAGPAQLMENMNIFPNLHCDFKRCNIWYTGKSWLILTYIITLISTHKAGAMAKCCESLMERAMYYLVCLHTNKLLVVWEFSTEEFILGIEALWSYSWSMLKTSPSYLYM